MRIRTIDKSILDEGMDAVLQALYGGAIVSPTSLYLAAQQGHTLITKIILAFGVDQRAAIRLASIEELEVTARLQEATLDAGVVRALFFWAISHYEPVRGTALLTRLMPHQALLDAKDKAGLMELAIYLNHEPIVKLLKTLPGIVPRRDALIRTPGYWAAKNGQDTLFGELHANDNEYALTLFQLKQDGLNDVFNKYFTLASPAVKKKYQKPIEYLPERVEKAPLTSTTQLSYEAVLKAKKDDILSFYSPTIHAEIVIHALENKNFVALAVLREHYLEQGALIVNLLEKRAHDTIDFSLIGNDISLLGVCLLLHSHSHIALRETFLEHHWSVEGVLRTLINYHLTSPLNPARMELFNHLRKRDTIVSAVLKSCLKDRYTIEALERIPRRQKNLWYQQLGVPQYVGKRYDLALMSSEKLADGKIEIKLSEDQSKLHYRMIGLDGIEKTDALLRDTLLHHNFPKNDLAILSDKNRLLPIILKKISEAGHLLGVGESKARKTNFPGNLPGALWKKILFEILYARVVPVAPVIDEKEDEEEKEQSLSERKIEIMLRRAPFPWSQEEIELKLVNKQFYLLLSTRKKQTEFFKIQQELNALIHCEETIRQEIAAKGICSVRVWPKECLISNLFLIGLFLGNIFCLIHFSKMKEIALANLNSILIPDRTKPHPSTCFEYYVSENSFECRSRYLHDDVINPLCKAACLLWEKYSDSTNPEFSLFVLFISLTIFLLHLVMGLTGTFSKGRERFEHRRISEIDLTPREEIRLLIESKIITGAPQLSEISVSEIKQQIAAALQERKEKSTHYPRLLHMHSLFETPKEDKKRGDSREPLKLIVDDNDTLRTHLLPRTAPARRSPCGRCVIL